MCQPALAKYIPRRMTNEKAVGTSIIKRFLFSDRQILLKTRHKLVDVIVPERCMAIAGAGECAEIAAFAQEAEDWFGAFLRLPGGIPTHDAFQGVFSLIDPKEFGNCLIHCPDLTVISIITSGICRHDARMGVVVLPGNHTRRCITHAKPG